MKRALIFLSVLSALLVVPAGAKSRAEKDALKAEKIAAKAASGAAGNASPKLDMPVKSEGFDGYKNVRGKNIFDPSRRGMSIQTPSTVSSSTTTRGRSLALTGTMVADGKVLAFFGGSAADGSRVISVGNSVANYKLTAIAPTEVTLEHEGKTLVLAVGNQINFDAGSGAPSAAGPLVEVAPEPAAETTGAPSLPGVSDDKAEILRRMMERRAKENGK